MTERIEDSNKTESALSRVVVLPVTERGVELGQRVGALFSNPRIYSYEELKSGGLKKVVKEVWRSCDVIVFICAAAIAVRMVAPLLKSKATDPAVLVMDETGRFVISLVSGHLGGANKLTAEIAAATGAVPVITTATDSHGLPCIEDIAEKFGLTIESLKKIKVINSAILDGGPVLVVDTESKRQEAIKEFVAGFGKEAASVFSFSKTIVLKDTVRAFVIITPAAEVEILHPIKRRFMLLRPRRYVAGIGCRRGVSADEVKRAVAKAMKEAGLSVLSLKSIATIDIKKDETGLLEYAKSAGVKIEFYTADELNRVEAVSESSPMVFKITGAKAVAEPAALISSNAEKLCQEKVKTKRVTVALAQARSL